MQEGERCYLSMLIAPITHPRVGLVFPHFATYLELNTTHWPDLDFMQC